MRVSHVSKHLTLQHVPKRLTFVRRQHYARAPPIGTSAAIAPLSISPRASHERSLIEAIEYAKRLTAGAMRA